MTEEEKELLRKKLDEENYEDLKLVSEENKKLMRKSFRMIISFLTFFVLCIGLFIYLQQNKFFIFNINRTFSNVPSPMIAEFFSIVFIMIIIMALITFIYLSIEYIKRKKLSVEEQLIKYNKFRRLFSIADIFSIVPIFLLVVMVVNGFFFSFAQVDGISMQPTFCDNDAVIIKYVEEYERNDIVILEQDDLYLIKRIVAVPGDTLEVNSIGVYVNGELIEDYTSGLLLTYTEFIIPEGYYYVLGDNRTRSEDSRVFGLKSEDNLLGIVVYRVSSQTCPID